MTSRSKNYYQGMHLKRMQRSEYDDAKLRDLARQDARLGHDLKTVERARQVMLKSMDADKQLFIKAGQQANSKMTRSIQGNWPRSASQPAPHHSRLVSDSKSLKKTTDHSDVNGHRSQSGSRSKKQGSGSESGSGSGSNNTSKQNTEPSKTEASSSIYDTSSVYDKFFEANTGMSSSGANVPGHDQDSKSATFKLGGSGRGMNKISETEGYASESIHGTTKHTRSHSDDIYGSERTVYRQNSEGSKSSALRQMSMNGDDHAHNFGVVDEADTDDERDVKGSSQGKRTGTGSTKEQDEESGKRQSVWDTLSTPKHTSGTKSKRNQIEKEFATSTPTLKNSTSSPALLSMVKTSTAGSTTKGKSGTKQRRSSQTSSASQQGRQVNGIGSRKNSSSKLRNDT